MAWLRAIRDATAKAGRDRVFRDVAVDGAAAGRPGRRRPAAKAAGRDRGPARPARARAARRPGHRRWSLPGPTGALACRAAITGLARARQLVVLAAATQPAGLVARRPGRRRLGRRRRPLIRAGRF